MYTLFVTCLIAITTALLFAWKLSRNRQNITTTYESRGKLLTPAERSFLRVLEQALDSRYRVFGKVRLADLIKPTRELDTVKRTTLLNQINQKHADFVICTANDLAVVGVVALDAPAYRYAEQAGRDGVIDQALATAGIPVLRLPARNEFSVQDVRTRLSEMMLADTISRIVSTAQLATIPVNHALDAILDSNPVQADSQIPACPKCSAAMVKRQAIRGKHTGIFFWACSTFPMCKEVQGVVE